MPSGVRALMKANESAQQLQCGECNGKTHLWEVCESVKASYINESLNHLVWKNLLRP